MCTRSARPWSGTSLTPGPARSAPWPAGAADDHQVGARRATACPPAGPVLPPPSLSPFSGWMRPTNSTTGTSSGRPTARRAWAWSPGEKKAWSTPGAMTSTRAGSAPYSLTSCRLLDARRGEDGVGAPDGRRFARRPSGGRPTLRPRPLRPSPVPGCGRSRPEGGRERASGRARPPPTASSSRGGGPRPRPARTSPAGWRPRRPSIPPPGQAAASLATGAGGPALMWWARNPGSTHPNAGWSGLSRRV